MEIAYLCPGCEQTHRAPVADDTAAITCTCGQQVRVPEGAYEHGALRRCLVCPSTDLFIRKDFPQRLGVALVVLGLGASCVAWAYGHLILTFVILFATALADLVLYVVVGDALMCYRCGAHYRGVEQMTEHGNFDLETHERHRQQKARLSQHARSMPREQDIGRAS